MNPTGDTTCPYEPWGACIPVRGSLTAAPVPLRPPQALRGYRDLVVSSGDLSRPAAALGFPEIYCFPCRRKVLTSSHELEGLSRTALSIPSPSASSFHLLSPPTPSVSRPAKLNLKIRATACSVHAMHCSKQFQLYCLIYILHSRCKYQSYVIDEGTERRVK